MSTPARYTPIAIQPRSDVSQATAVEQTRAIAEVQAAIVVAQQVRRDTERAVAEMRDSCQRMAMAERAFYAVKNRGTGPSVHLMKELARIWGNIQYGVHELRRDDEKGESEVQAFAWDVETNSRNSRTFQQPHARMKSGKREKLTELHDIYLSNQNTGARAVRECIDNVLPKWFTEEAQTICRRTLEHGEGVPMEERKQNMIASFRGIGVKVDQLETKIGRPRGQWTAADLAQMGVLFTSITRDGLPKDEEFPPVRLTAEEITKGRTKANPREASTDPVSPAEGEAES